ncbi:MAG: hypothetical protein PHR21_04805 [Oscillospiraceae bacterium]|nr:hypothetical protein [Oscillospiraceae bacterium]MDD4367412.1 hypothetical protein [Oscillospiraceae bacterium]
MSPIRTPLITTVACMMYSLLQLSLGLPQSLLGLLLCLLQGKARPRRFYRGCIVTGWRHAGGVSLGLFIFIPAWSGAASDPDTAAALSLPPAWRPLPISSLAKLPPAVRRIAVHEYGHTWQSLLLGPLYLPVIGLSSFIWANWPCCRRWRQQSGRSYSWFWTEAWANRWGEASTRLPGLD